jgi:outer membrane protein assembly factor BamB
MRQRRASGGGRPRRQPQRRRAREGTAPGWHKIDRSKPHLLPTKDDYDPAAVLKLHTARNPFPRATLGDFGLAVRINGPERFAETILVHPVGRSELAGIDARSVRVFRADEEAKTLRPVWNSGLNLPLGFAWARVQRPGAYVAIGLPRDRLLQEAIRRMAHERRFRDSDEEADAALRPLLELPLEALQELREYLARVEIQTSLEGLSFLDVEMGPGRHPLGFRLPGGVNLAELRKRVERLQVPPGGLPEEQLFYPPEIPRNGEPPWDTPPDAGPWRGVDWRGFDHLSIWKDLRHEFFDHVLPPWLFSQDWWMYQHDERHTGHASGLTDISATTVSGLYLHKTVAVDGPVVSKPSIVDAKVYVGSGKSGGSGGTLYKIDLYTGTIEHALATSGMAHYGIAGIGGSPAVVGDRVYFTAVHGTVFCVNANTFAPVWSVSLKSADVTKNQPVTNPEADSWTGPLVVNGKVYVGCGEGEWPTTYGFVFCLDAATGNVIWCFCTCKFAGAGDNQPNHLPTAVAAPWAAAHGFAVQPNPPETGCSVWSSPAYDSVHKRIYVGTGNSQYPHTAQPDELYGSGLISLDADTGAFEGFFQPTPTDSYWPADYDIDVPGSPAVYSIGGQRVVAFGSKNGSFFVLDAGNVTNVIARRQLLPRVGGTGLPGDAGTSITDVVPNGVENKYGVFGTPAIHFGLHRLFVGLGGYDGMHIDAGAGIDQTRTPFMRALNWGDLHDAWPTSVGADGIIRYTNTKPPMYSSHEVGLSSPAVVSDIVFVTTSGAAQPGFYALSVNDGHCLWTAGGLPTGQFVLGPTVYGNYVVVGAGDRVYIYRLGPRWRFPPWPILYRKPWPWEIAEEVGALAPELPIGPWPGPDPALNLREG